LVTLGIYNSAFSPFLLAVRRSVSYTGAMFITKHKIKRITLLFILIVFLVLIPLLLTSRSTKPGLTSKNSQRRFAAVPISRLRTTKIQNSSTIGWVTEQNRLKGSTAWKINGSSAGNKLEGFINTTYTADKQDITFYISTTALHYRVRAFRMGYYQGKGARLIWVSKLLTGSVQRQCKLSGHVNMVSCDNWKPSLHLWLSKAFVQGDYLFELVAKGNLKNYIPLTVWDPSSKATYVIKNDVLTWQAWNGFGGYDFYTGAGNCPTDVYPLCSRARVVSFDRPYAYGDGAGDFLTNEYPLIYLAEEHGLNITYITDITLIQHPGLLKYHSALLSLGHDECWSYNERFAVEQAAKLHGLNVAFFGASAMLRHVRLQASPLGPDREEVDYRDSYADPLDNNGHPKNPMLVTGNTWSSPPSNWPETSFVGENYIGYLQSQSQGQPLVITDSKSFLFKDILYLHKPVYDGEKIPGIIASDIDTSGTKADNVTVVASSPISTQYAYVQPSNLVNGFAYSDMAYHLEKPSNALIFDSGTNNWIASMTACAKNTPACPANFSQAVTLNLLKKMALRGV